MLAKYPLPEPWIEVYDAGLARHYYWNQDTDDVSNNFVFLFGCFFRFVGFPHDILLLQYPSRHLKLLVNWQLNTSVTKRAALIQEVTEMTE